MWQVFDEEKYKIKLKNAIIFPHWITQILPH